MADAYVAEAVRALLEERRGYELRGLRNRVAQVDEQLAKLGHQERLGVEVSAPGSEEAGAPSPGVEEAGGPSARRKSGRRDSD